MSTLSFDAGQHRLLKCAKKPQPGMRLLELDACTLDDICAGSVVIKGAADAEAVLCSATRTYALKIVETTNSLLLVPPVQDGEALSTSPDKDAENLTGNISPAPAFQTQAMKSGAASHPMAAIPAAASHLEMVQVAPRLQTLDTLLEESKYGEDDIQLEGGDAPMSDKLTYTFEDLLDQVQASPAELQRALQDRHAIELDYAWRIVDKAYMEGLLETALFLAAQQGWSHDALPQNDLVEGLQANGHDARPMFTMPDDINNHRVVASLISKLCKVEICQLQRLVLHFLSVFGLQQADQIWRLDPTKVCTVFAENLLHSKAKWQQEEFMESWQNAVPQGMCPDLSMLKGQALQEENGISKAVKLFSVEQLPSEAAARFKGMQPDVSMLKGLALQEENGSSKAVKLFSVHQLPSEPAARFKALFQERAQWSWQDLQPYVEDLQGPGQSVEALLLKYARRVQQHSEAAVLYSAR